MTPPSRLERESFTRSAKVSQMGPPSRFELEAFARAAAVVDAPRRPDRDRSGPRRNPSPVRALRTLAVALLLPVLTGCVVVTVAGAAVSAGAAVVGTAVDVAVGAVKVTGKAVGSAVDAISGSAQDEPRKPAEEPKKP